MRVDSQLDRDSAGRCGLTQEDESSSTYPSLNVAGDTRHTSITREFSALRVPALMNVANVSEQRCGLSTTQLHPIADSDVGCKSHSILTIYRGSLTVRDSNCTSIVSVQRASGDV